VLEAGARALNISNIKRFILCVMNADALEIHCDPKSVCQRRLNCLLLCAFIGSYQGKPGSRVSSDAVASNAKSTFVECAAEMMRGIAWHALGHSGDDNALIALRQHACFGDGLP
jgi:hypothetical protein